MTNCGEIADAGSSPEQPALSVGIILEELLRLDQQVIGIDNFATGYPGNLDEVHSIGR